MVRLGDLARRGAVLALAELGRREPLLMKDFTVAAELQGQAARQLRADLETMGLIQTNERQVGGRTEINIRLTPLGKIAADHLIVIEDAFANTNTPPSRTKR